MFKFCLTFFQVCGFYPIKISKDIQVSPGLEPKASSHSRFLSFYSLLMSLFILSAVMFVAIENKRMIYADTMIGKFNDILIYFSLLIAHFSIIIESYFKRDYFIKFWNHFSRLIQIRNPSTRSQWKRKIHLKLIIFVLYSVVSEILVITHIESDQQWTNFWCAQIFSLLMTRHRHLQHIFFIDIIFFTLNDINAHLRNTIAWTKVIPGDRKFSRVLLCKTLLETKEQFKGLMEMLICVNRIFCWSQVLNVAQHFLQVTSDLFWVYAYATGPTFLWRE